MKAVETEEKRNEDRRKGKGHEGREGIKNGR